MFKYEHDESQPIRLSIGGLVEGIKNWIEKCDLRGHKFQFIANATRKSVKITDEFCGNALQSEACYITITMKTSVILLGAAAALGLSLSCASFILADQVRYMDTAGNIHFVDRLNDVPRQYRPQVITPTPAPILDKRAIAELKRKKKEDEVERMRKEHDRARAIKERQIIIERERKKEERELKRQDDSRRVDHIGR